MVRFLASRLSVSSDAQKASEAGGEFISRFKEVKLLAESANVKSGRILVEEFNQTDSDKIQLESSEDNVIASGQSSTISSLMTVRAGQDSLEKGEASMNKLGQEELNVSTIECSDNYKQKEESCEENLDEEESSTDLAVKKSELERLEEEYDLLKTVVEIAFDNDHPIDFYTQQLNSVMESRKDALAKLESHW